jgi:hypothetical protein
MMTLRRMTRPKSRCVFHAAGGISLAILLGSTATYAQEGPRAGHVEARIDQVFGLVDPASAAALPRAGRGDLVRPGRVLAAVSDLVVNGIRFPRPKPSSSDVAVEPLALLPVGGPLELVAGAASAVEERWVESPAVPQHTQSIIAPELVAAPAAAPCIAAADANDGDGDLTRNAAVVGQDGMCITERSFKERKRGWTVHTVASGRPGPLWIVAHDDEDSSFDTAAYGLQTYGGTLLAVETDGSRNNDGIDPNRNLSEEGLSCRIMGDESSPVFTGMVRALVQPGQPIFAVHNAPAGERSGKRGHATVSSPPRGAKVVPSENADSDLASDFDLVLLAAVEADEQQAEARARTLAQQGLNVIIESVSKKSYDCSLSNFAAVSSNIDYFNITVDRDAGDKQRRMVDLIMASFFTGAPSQ